MLPLRGRRHCGGGSDRDRLRLGRREDFHFGSHRLVQIAAAADAFLAPLDDGRDVGEGAGAVRIRRDAQAGRHASESCGRVHLLVTLEFNKFSGAMEWQNFPKGGTYYGQLINCSALAGRRLGGHGLVHQLLGEGRPELLDRSGGLNNLLATLRVGTTPFNIFLLL